MFPLTLAADAGEHDLTIHKRDRHRPQRGCLLAKVQIEHNGIQTLIEYCSTPEPGGFDYKLLEALATGRSWSLESPVVEPNLIGDCQTGTSRASSSDTKPDDEGHDDEADQNNDGSDANAEAISGEPRIPDAHLVP